jgi:segregation and condensation protein B
MRRKTIEAALFLASGPLSITDLMNIAECSAGELEDVIALMRERFNQDSGIKFLEANNSYQLIVNPEVIHKVKQLSPYRDLSPGLVKALSVIAFKGPLKQSILVNTIGNRAYEYIGELEKRGLITAKREGRTRILKVTKLFVDYFGESVPANNLERFLEERGEKPVKEKKAKSRQRKRRASISVIMEMLMIISLLRSRKCLMMLRK